MKDLDSRKQRLLRELVLESCTPSPCWKPWEPPIQIVDGEIVLTPEQRRNREKFARRQG